LKTFYTDIIQHKIPLNVGSNPFRKKIRKFIPLLMYIIEKELKRMLDYLRYSYWVANLVLIRKTNGEIRFYVDFRNLNRCPLKDKYPLSNMDHILQREIGTHTISMLDGHSGYNQIELLEEDKEKTTFTTPWGTLMYDKMSF
jgi:hypothetical protein